MPGPGPKKPKPRIPTIEQAVAGADALPRRPAPRMVPYMGPGGTERMVPVSDSNRPIPLSMRTSTNVPEALQWQKPFIDSLAALVGDAPGQLVAEPYFTNTVGGEFDPKADRITLAGNIMGMTPASAGHTRWAAAHEFGHLLSHNDDAIMQAFMGAAPLPRRLNTRADDNSESLAKVWSMGYDRNGPTIDSSRTPNLGREYIAGEAFADMFADALSRRRDNTERFPDMWDRYQWWVHYPFTDQFRSASRERMVDSLVNTLLPRLQQ